MNTELLMKIADKILKHPLRFDMENWIKSLEKEPTKDFFCYCSTLIDGWNECKTSACIAGWAVLLSKDEENKNLTIPEEAERLLQLNVYQSNRLFYVTLWPRRFLNDYLLTRDEVTRAKITTERIHHFIKTNGEE